MVVGDYLFPLGVLVLSAVVLGGALIFFVWSGQHYLRQELRKANRQYLYVPVVARVKRIWMHSDCATLFVVYDFGGIEISNRFTATHAEAALAKESMQIFVRIDPEHPRDIVIAPEFKIQAASIQRPPGVGMPLGATTLSEFAMLLLVCTLLGGGLAAGLQWLKKGTVDRSLVVMLALLLPIMYVVRLFVGASIFAANNKRRRDSDGEQVH